MLKLYLFSVNNTKIGPVYPLHLHVVCIRIDSVTYIWDLQSTSVAANYAKKNSR